MGTVQWVEYILESDTKSGKLTVRIVRCYQDEVLPTTDGFFLMALDNMLRDVDINAEKRGYKEIDELFGKGAEEILKKASLPDTCGMGIDKVTKWYDKNLRRYIKSVKLLKYTGVNEFAVADEKRVFRPASASASSRPRRASKRTTDGDKHCVGRAASGLQAVYEIEVGPKWKNAVKFFEKGSGCSIAVYDAGTVASPGLLPSDDTPHIDDPLQGQPDFLDPRPPWAVVEAAETVNVRDVLKPGFLDGLDEPSITRIYHIAHQCGFFGDYVKAKSMADRKRLQTTFSTIGPLQMRWLLITEAARLVSDKFQDDARGPIDRVHNDLSPDSPRGLTGEEQRALESSIADVRDCVAFLPQPLKEAWSLGSIIRFLDVMTEKERISEDNKILRPDFFVFESDSYHRNVERIL